MTSEASAANFDSQRELKHAENIFYGKGGLEAGDKDDDLEDIMSQSFGFYNGSHPDLPPNNNNKNPSVILQIEEEIKEPSELIEDGRKFIKRKKKKKKKNSTNQQQHKKQIEKKNSWECRECDQPMVARCSLQIRCLSVNLGCYR